MSIAEQACEFVGWLRREGWCGWLLPVDIIAAYQWWTDEARIEKLPADTVLAAVALEAGVERHRKRLAGLQSPEFAHIRCRTKHLVRPVVYLIFDDDEFASMALPTRAAA